MIDLAFYILAAAALIGAVLAILYARGAAKPMRQTIPVIHALIGAGGLVVLIAALRHGPGAAATRMGMASFGPFAAGLIALALLIGLAVAGLAWRGKRPNGALIGAHATFAIAGVTLLLAVIALS